MELMRSMETIGWSETPGDRIGEKVDTLDLLGNQLEAMTFVYPSLKSVLIEYFWSL